jgi:hypothetical protein
MKSNSSGHSLASGVKRVFFAAIVILSMSTSFLYFVAVFSFGAGMVSDNVTSVLINGSIGVLVTDFAALAWLTIYLRASDNNDLRNLAIIGAAIGVLGSTIASLAYLLLVAGDAYQVTAEMSAWTQWALAAVIVVHFLLVFLSSYKSTSAKIDEKTAALLADATEEMLVLTQQEFQARIPALAQRNADILTRELAGRFASLTAHDSQRSPSPVSPPEQRQEEAQPFLSANGRRP